MRYWVGVTSALALGGLVGYVVGVVATEEKAKQKYVEASASMRRAVELAKNLPEKAEAPAETEEELLEETLEEIAHTPVNPIAVLSGFEVNVTDMKGLGKPTMPDVNPYHVAMNAVETDQELFIEGGVNDYGVSYIEEEEYDEDDGRTKYHVDYIPGDTGAVFVMGGHPIDDWAERLGESIIVDFFRFVPPGAAPILYVRNHKTDEDYEVVQGSP